MPELPMPEQHWFLDLMSPKLPIPREIADFLVGDEIVVKIQNGAETHWTSEGFYGGWREDLDGLVLFLKKSDGVLERFLFSGMTGRQLFRNGRMIAKTQ